MLAVDTVQQLDVFNSSSKRSERKISLKTV